MKEGNLRIQDELLKNNNLLLQDISNGSLFEEKIIIFIEQVSDKITNLIEAVITNGSKDYDPDYIRSHVDKLTS